MKTVQCIPKDPAKENSTKPLISRQNKGSTVLRESYQARQEIPGKKSCPDFG